MGLRNMWVEESDFLAIFEEVHRRKTEKGGRVTGAEALRVEAGKP